MQVHKIETIEELKNYFPEGEADGDNFCLFSTSGVHGHYGKIEDVEFEENEEGWIDNKLTILVVQPRVVNLIYGHVEIEERDLDYLKKLRQSSWDVVNNIGRKF